jgi:hypothetical protein
VGSLRLSGAGSPLFESRDPLVEFSCRIAAKNAFAMDGLLQAGQALLVFVNPISQLAHLAPDVPEYIQCVIFMIYHRLSAIAKTT